MSSPSYVYHGREPLQPCLTTRAGRSDLRPLRHHARGWLGNHWLQRRLGGRPRAGQNYLQRQRRGQGELLGSVRGRHRGRHHRPPSRERTRSGSYVAPPDDWQCGAGPFARIVSTVDVTEDGPEEHDVILDYAFDQITHERGEVAFEVTSTNVEDVITGDSSGPLQASRFARRVQSGHSLVSRITKSKTFNLPPINLHRDFNLFNASIDCPATAAGAGFSAGLDVDVNVGVDAQVAFGFTVSGKIFWPKITKFEVFGSQWTRLIGRVHRLTRLQT